MVIMILKTRAKTISSNNNKDNINNSYLTYLLPTI